MKNKVKPIFLISLVRSGSTLLQRALAGHSKISTTGEPWLLLPFIYAFKKEGTITEYAHATSHTGVADLIEALPGKYDDYYKYLSDFVLKLYSSVSQPDEVYFLDKTPRYYLIVDELERLFPEAKFIFLFRNPVHIYASIMSTWGNNSFKAFNRYGFYSDLSNGFEMLSAAYKKLESKSISVQYERFIAQPEKVINEVLDYLELSNENHLVESINNHDTRGRNYDPTMDLSRLIDDSSLHKWKITFNTRFRKTILREYIIGLSDECLVIQGYQKSDIMSDLQSLDNKGKFNVIRDIFDYNRAKFINRFNRLSFC